MMDAQASLAGPQPCLEQHAQEQQGLDIAHSETRESGHNLVPASGVLFAATMVILDSAALDSDPPH